MNNRQKTGLLVIVIGLLIIAAIVYFIFLKKPETPSPLDNPGATTTGQLPTPEESDITPGDKPRNYQQYDISKEAPHETDSADVSKLAASFAERLGSFSNQSDYSNFDDLDIFMTANMREWADGYVAKMRQDNAYDGSYYGMTTIAVSTEAKSFDANAGKAEIVVGTQRREVRGQGGENNYNQDLLLVFVRENGRWLVDGAYWLE
ncbi:MAG: hypothetical protein ACM3PZ_02215 [Bacillota bacterium]